MAERAFKRMTVDEFVRWEDGTDTRYELIEGAPVAMAPPMPGHGVLALGAELRSALHSRRSCVVQAEAGIARPERDDTCYIADLAVTCDPPRPGDRLILDDAAIMRAWAKVAKAGGLLLCPAGAATYAAYEQALGDGRGRPGERVVLFNCATGLKYPVPKAGTQLQIGEAIDWPQLVKSSSPANPARRGPARRRRYGRASRIMLNGVSVARRTWRKPPAVMTSRNLASPAWAPRAAPTSCASEVGTHTIVEAA
jgi:Putative restriction endonuclease